MDVTARRLGWTQADGWPEYVSGELVIHDAEAGLRVAGQADARGSDAGDEPARQAPYALHLVDGYAVDPESVVALRWADLQPASGRDRPL